jgi:hypothetical protein
MEGTGFLAVAGLIAALAIMAGLWEWRRRSRTSGFETAPRTAAATLRVSAPEVTRSDRNLDSGSLRPGPSTKTELDSPAGASAAIPAGPALAGPAAAHPSEALREDEAPAQSDTPELASQPAGPGLHIPPPLPPSSEEETGPVPPHDGDETDGPEPILQPADSGSPVLDTAGQPAETATDATVAQDASVTAHRDSAGPLPPSLGTSDAPGDADPAEEHGPDDTPQEGIDEQPSAEAAVTGGTDTHESGTTAHRDGAAPLRPSSDAPSDPSPADAESLDDTLQESIEDQPDADQQALPCAEPDADTAGLLSSSADEAETEDTVEVEPEPGPDPDLPSAPETPAGPALRPPRQPAIHRDRRGKRRAVTAAAPPQPVAPAPGAQARPPAEAKLRLSLHPIRRTARLSVVLTRPDGFPARVTVLEASSDAVEAYDEQRYDDLDMPWTSELLEGELRLMSGDGFQWLRSARQVHIFAQDPNEPELISTSAAKAGIAHTLICRSGDAETVRLAASATGSPELQTHEHWQGIPDGWLVLSGYTPVHAAAPPLPTGFRTMDPGEGLEISFEGGLAVRGRVYAAGHPPRIIIAPAPGAASVTIGGTPAEFSSSGAWTAPGWDAPGQHIVDVVPGPSASYEIAADPWLAGGWDFWDAHPQRFGNGAREPWARAKICGALIRGPADETVFAAETQPTLVALGARAGATPLRRRADAGVSVGLMAEPPAFLLSATGSRRSQGRVVWLGLAPSQNPSRQHDAEWVATVRGAAARRLPLVQADGPGEDAWRKAKERARRLRNRRPRP